MASANTITFNQLLEIYQQSRIRGEWATLSLETKDGREFINFTLGGPPGIQSGHSFRSGQVRRKTPSQQRRDQKRKLEFYAKKKASEEIEKAGVKPNQLVIELDKGKENNETSEIFSPITQLDGQSDSEDAIFSFKSEYREEDIVSSLTEILPENLVNRATLVSRVAVRPFNPDFSADHQCTVLVAAVDQNFAWPAMKDEQKEVFRELKKTQK